MTTRAAKTARRTARNRADARRRNARWTADEVDRLARALRAGGARQPTPDEVLAAMLADGSTS